MSTIQVSCKLNFDNIRKALVELKDEFGLEEVEFNPEFIDSEECKKIITHIFKNNEKYQAYTIENV